MNPNAINIEFLITKIDALPTLPTIYHKLMEVMDNPRSSAQDVANVIIQDQASATKVLKASNSPLYGFYGRIDNISQAISYIGFDEVKSLIIALTIIDFFNNKFDTKHFDLISFWKHSIAVGIMTRLIGKAIRAKDLENYFLAGIMHDIGRLFFMITIPEQYAKVIEYCQENRTTLREAEINLLGISHGIAGEMLANKWNLPKSIQNVIRYQNYGILENNNKSLVAACHVANVSSNIFGYSYSDELIITPPNKDIWEILDLPNNFFSSVSKLMTSSYTESTNLLLR